MSQTNEYDGDVTAGRDEIASMLSGLADGIRTGSVRLGTDADAMIVETPDELTLEIELETEAGERSLELELEWPVSGDTAPVPSIEDEPKGLEEEPTGKGVSDGPESLATFEVYQASDEKWHWRLRHDNGNIIATGGQGYTQKHNALKGLRSVLANSTAAAINEPFTG